PRPPCTKLFPYTTLFRSPRTTRTARCGRKDGARMRRHDAETVGERIGIELRTKKSAAIPVGRLGHDALKGFAPILFNAEGHGEGDRKSTRLNSSHEWISY